MLGCQAWHACILLEQQWHTVAPRQPRGSEHSRPAGCVLATKQDIKPYPTRTNQIPRHIPPPHWASHPAVLFLAAGLLPYGTIFVELYFAMTSIWQVPPCCQILEAAREADDGHFMRHLLVSLQVCEVRQVAAC